MSAVQSANSTPATTWDAAFKVSTGGAFAFDLNTNMTDQESQIYDFEDFASASTSQNSIRKGALHMQPSMQYGELAGFRKMFALDLG